MVGSGDLADRAKARAGVADADVFGSAGRFLPLGARTPGAVLLPSDGLPADDLVAVLLACVRAGDGWAPLLVEPDGAGVVAIPLMRGPAHPLEELAPAAEGAVPPALRLSDLERELRRVRHDVNNPLGAAFAEVQLLLMDATDPELRRSLETIQEQLRRMRDRLTELKLPAAG